MSQMYYFYYNLMLLLLLLIAPGCVQHSKKMLKQITIKNTFSHSFSEHTMHPLADPPPVNIWIHGTLFIYKPFFHQIFNKESVLNLGIYINKDFYTHEIAELLTHQNPTLFPLETLYAFGWSGRLSAVARAEAGKKLYLQLIDLVKKYQQKWHTYPVIRIISHSHGGNVALNLALAERMYQQSLKIDTLLLLACPVQQETSAYTTSPIFNRIYSLSSSLDLIQLIAPQQGIETFRLSYRLFPPSPHIIQAKVRLNGKAILHTQFVSPLFIQSIPAILEELQSTQEEVPDLFEKNITIRITTEHKRIRCIQRIQRARRRLLFQRRKAIYDLCRKKTFLHTYL